MGFRRCSVSAVAALSWAVLQELALVLDGCVHAAPVRAQPPSDFLAATCVFLLLGFTPRNETKVFVFVHKKKNGFLQVMTLEQCVFRPAVKGAERPLSRLET